MAVGIREMVDYDVASSSADLITYFVEGMVERGIPAVTPPGGLAGHVDATRFLPHLQQSQYIAGALNAAVYLVSGVRGMERGTISMDRDAQGNDVFSDMELCRLAVPRRVYTVSHMDYVVDRLDWLYQHRNLVGGLKFVHEPPVLRFFTGKLEPSTVGANGWPRRSGPTSAPPVEAVECRSMNSDEFRRWGHRLIDWIADYLDHVEQYPVMAQVKPGDIRAGFRQPRRLRGEAFDAILRDVEQIILPGITHWQSPNFFGFFPSNNSGPSILGELLSAGLGVQGMLWSTSPACTELETHVLDWLVDLLGLPASFKSTSTGGGVIQDSASSATLCAILAARERATDGRSNSTGGDGIVGGLHLHASPFVGGKGSADRRAGQR